MKAALASDLHIHRHGKWVVAATISAMGPDRCKFEYSPEYVFSDDPWPVALGWPVALDSTRLVESGVGMTPDRRPPSFLYDLVPQGRGRKYLVDLLQLQGSDALVLPLLMAGAFNPIGCLRLASAVDFYREQARRNPVSTVSNTGFTREAVLTHSQDFLGHLALHAMLASGTTGVQGVAPKFLLSTDREGRWFADMELPDELAQEHWLVKLARGKSDDDRAVLRNEAAYLQLAEVCGLRSVQSAQLLGDALFLRRFDRAVIDGQVIRLHQESLASLCDLRGFGVTRSQQELLAGIRGVVSRPFEDTVEFLRRDILNQAMRNTDNHARNTAVQRLANGTVQLTPVFDFAPMFLDSEVVARSCHWRDASGKIQDTWTQVLESLDVDDHERGRIAAALVEFAPQVGSLAQTAAECGVEPAVIEACRRTIDRQAEQLQALSSLVPRNLVRERDRG